MKTIMRSTVCVLLAVWCLLSFTACGQTEAQTEAPATSVNQTEQPVTDMGLWKDAVYQTDTTFGEGTNTLTVEVKAENKAVTFTVNTDKDTVGDALIEHGLLDGEEGPYGLYVKVVNGITADYDADQSYWAFYVDGEYAMTGVDTTPITEGATYQLVYTK